MALRGGRLRSVVFYCPTYRRSEKPWSCEVARTWFRWLLRVQGHRRTQPPELPFPILRRGALVVESWQIWEVGIQGFSAVFSVQGCVGVGNFKSDSAP